MPSQTASNIPAHGQRIISGYLLVFGAISALVAAVSLMIVDADLKSKTLEKVDSAVQSREFELKLSMNLEDAANALGVIAGDSGKLTILQNVGPHPVSVSRNNWESAFGTNTETRYIDFNDESSFYKVTIQWRQRWSHLPDHTIPYVLVAFLVLTALMVGMARKHFQSRIRESSP